MFALVSLMIVPILSYDKNLYLSSVILWWFTVAFGAIGPVAMLVTVLPCHAPLSRTAIVEFLPVYPRAIE